LIMSMQAAAGPVFIRKTELGPNEYRKNFRQIDNDIITAITSPAADAVTPLMSKVYLRLISAPGDYWESPGVLRFEAATREGKPVKAWALLCDLVGVSSATASKALRWMREQAIIGYFSGKNGLGIRIFLNRAAASIGTRGPQEEKKILPYSPASTGERAASPNEAPFKESYRRLENLDMKKNTPAPENGAGKKTQLTQSPDSHPQAVSAPAIPPADTFSRQEPGFCTEPFFQSLVSRLNAELQPSLRAFATAVAAKEHENNRRWLEERGLPKAVRVAQHEALTLLQRIGVLTKKSGRTHDRPAADLFVGRTTPKKSPPSPLSPDEIEELADICVYFQTERGQNVDVTLSELSTEVGERLLPEDAPRVRQRALEKLAHT
jgi:hypothetical protein